MTLLDIVIKVEEKGKEHLQYTWNLGTMTHKISLNLKKIMAKKNKELEIYFMLFGSLIYL